MMSVEDTVHKVQRHRFNKGVILGAIARTKDNQAKGQVVVTNAALVNQTIESLLNLVCTGIQFIQKKTIRLLAGYHAGRAETAGTIKNLWHANNIFGCELTPQ